MSKYPNWTLEEDKILYEVYEKEDKNVILQRLSNRDWQAIQVRASRFKLKRMNYFSDDEINFIRNNYLTMRSGKIGKILGRGSKVVENKARQIGLIKQVKWTKKEEKFLLSNFNVMSLIEISKELKKSMSAIYHRVQELNLQRKTERYSMSDKDLLKSLVLISKEIGRTPNSRELVKLGLPSAIVFAARFGSYGNACVLGKLDVNTGIVSRKIYLSKNGDLCLSNAEKKITDFFIDNSISYLKETPYFKIIEDPSCGKMLSDWLFEDGTVVEYFGMDRHKKYAEKMKRKIELCEKHKISLIQIFDKDLNNLEKIFQYYI